MMVDVYEDDYRGGEIRHANYWEDSHEIDTDDKIIAIAGAMEKSCCSFNEQYLYEDEGVYRYSILVDEDNCEASKNEIEQWKKGDKTLYSANIEFKLYQIIEL